ncbi:MAG: nuclear transport factor 2-like protein [Acidimicrobiales bacterium]
MTEVFGAKSTTVETYYEILQSGAEPFDPERLRAILAPELVFEGPITWHRVGAEPFCKGVVGFVAALRHLEMRQLLTAPGKAAALYDAELPGGTCRFAEFFELDAGVITGLRLVFDPKRYIELGGH